MLNQAYLTPVKVREKADPSGRDLSFSVLLTATLAVTRECRFSVLHELVPRVNNVGTEIWWTDVPLCKFAEIATVAALVIESPIGSIPNSI